MDRYGTRRQKYVFADSRLDCQHLINEIVYPLQISDFANAGRLTADAYFD